jgi:hypothetical protein
MEADSLKEVTQVKDERHPQQLLERVDSEIGQFSRIHPGPDMKRQSPAAAVKIAHVRQGTIVVHRVWGWTRR